MTSSRVDVTVNDDDLHANEHNTFTSGLRGWVSTHCSDRSLTTASKQLEFSLSNQFIPLYYYYCTILLNVAVDVLVIIAVVIGVIHTSLHQLLSSAILFLATRHTADRVGLSGSRS